MMQTRQSSSKMTYSFLSFVVMRLHWTKMFVFGQAVRINVHLNSLGGCSQYRLYDIA